MFSPLWVPERWDQLQYAEINSGFQTVQRTANGLVNDRNLIEYNNLWFNITNFHTIRSLIVAVFGAYRVCFKYILNFNSTNNMTTDTKECEEERNEPTKSWTQNRYLLMKSDRAHTVRRIILGISAYNIEYKSRITWSQASSLISIDGTFCYSTSAQVQLTTLVFPL